MRTWLVMLALAAGTVEAAEGKGWKDSRGKSVFFPLGALSFADEVVSFDPGPRKGPPADSLPQQALGPPDVDEKVKGQHHYTTLGCGGTLVLRFTDNAVVDVPGADLFVFEIGPQVEATDLSLSVDGRTWVQVGRVSGGTAEVDIAGKVAPGESYAWVKLQDLKSGCGSRWPGADLDAVGAMGSGLSLRLDAAVLFDFGKASLKPEAKAELEQLSPRLRAYPGATVRVHGHTDSVGGDEANRKLSLDRATAVRGWLEQALGMEHVDVKGHGASRPVADNATEEGRQKNRRVEILLVPAPPATRPPSP